MHVSAPIIPAGVLHCQRMRVSLCYELTSSAERNKRERDKQTARGRRTQTTNNSDPITSELLLRQNSVTADAHQSSARRLASDHRAKEIHRSKSAVRPIRKEMLEAVTRGPVKTRLANRFKGLV
jgi:hypothetical protein